MPALFHDSNFISDFKEKSELLKPFLSKLWSIIDNGSKLPSDIVYLTELSDIEFSSGNSA